MPKYDITLYVSFIGFTLDSIPSPNENRLPKIAFETLLLVASFAVVVVTGGHWVVVDATALAVILDATIIASVKMVAAAMTGLSL